MADQVRKVVEQANKSVYGRTNVLRCYYGQGAGYALVLPAPSCHFCNSVPIEDAKGTTLFAEIQGHNADALDSKSIGRQDVPTREVT